jgi:hypothetical protein
MLGVEKACITLGLRGIDVRHEQAAAMAGFAYSRLLNRPSFCIIARTPYLPIVGVNLPLGLVVVVAVVRPSMDFLSRGHMLADVAAIIGSLDIVFGEIDR